MHTAGTGGNFVRERTFLAAHSVPVGLISIGLLVRLLVLVLPGPNAPDWDSVNFFRTAESMLAGNGYVGIRGAVNVVHAPLYPLLIALGMLVTHHAAIVSGLAISIIAGALFPVCLYGIASRVFDRQTGIVAGAIAAVHPVLVTLSLAMLADQLELTLAFAGLSLLLQWLDDRRTVQLALCGMVLGFAYLARAEALLYVAIACAVLVAHAFRTPKTVAGLLLALVAPFVVLAAPYVIFLSAALGGVRLEAKSPVNYAIGTRIERGMSYSEAADGLGLGLADEGADVGDGFFATHAKPYGPTLPERVAFAAREWPHSLGEAGKRIVSVHYGTPLFAIAALVGLARAFRQRRSAQRAVIVLACFAGQLAALASVAHFWDRYAAPLAPYTIIFGAAGAAWAWNRLPSAALRRGALAIAGVLAFAFVAYTVRDARANALDPRPLQAAGAWISRNAPRGAMIQSITPLVPYYAGARWNALPYSDSATAAAYLRKKHPDLVVLEPRDEDRPYLAAWRAHGIPDGTARLVYRSPGAGAEAILIYTER